MASFGQIIAEARKRAGLSQKELASKTVKEDGTSISPQYLNDIEWDRRSPTSESLINQFAKHLNLSKEYLMLAAGTLSKDDQKNVASADPAQVEKAMRAFRRTIKGSSK